MNFASKHPNNCCRIKCIKHGDSFILKQLYMRSSKRMFNPYPILGRPCTSRRCCYRGAICGGHRRGWAGKQSHSYVLHTMYFLPSLGVLTKCILEPPISTCIILNTFHISLILALPFNFTTILGIICHYHF